jgi:hypothetical protein
MSAADMLPPVYLDVSEGETGRSFGLDFQTYRLLARTSLSVIQNVPNHFMGIYRAGECVSLDIWGTAALLTICIDSGANRLELFLCDDLDSPQEPVCILSTDNSLSGWRTLGQLARAEMSRDS